MTWAEVTTAILVALCSGAYPRIAADSVLAEVAKRESRGNC